MTKSSDVADWISENVALSPPGASVRLSGYQRAIVEAIADPAVKVRFPTPAEMWRAGQRTEAAHLMLWAALQGRGRLALRADAGCLGL
ncbi:hypothetical protein MKK50_15800 [Methylobacterium sp. J-043]|jgi:hypothetical protein|nr:MULTISPECIES: hypothetical protein [unclassified Methylobacterium]KQP04887.1 hypothetical protein ASF28_18850 [Methylobacterium sp. Leaf99]KQT49069.1 hypothetical protein ASG52_08810 [Methylobacterium sp. Leaf456]MCJ2030836.1 hypothetical protein [Methylobacterium sp. J-043]